MQQVGGSLGLAVLVTVFGTATRSARHAANATAGQVFTHGADRAFLAAAAMLAVTVAVVAVAMRPGRTAPDRETAELLEEAVEQAPGEAVEVA